MKNILKGLCPPFLFSFLRSLKWDCIRTFKRAKKTVTPDSQELDIYWDADFAQKLDTWGEGTVWNEIQFFMVNCQGKILDIACGTGKTIEILSNSFPSISIFGCDISDKLIEKAISRGIPKEQLRVCDATKTGYAGNYFDHAYTIGSLEHFTEKGIDDLLKENCRIVRGAVFHQIPVSKKDKDEGWITREQAYFNNTSNWWLIKFRQHYKNVYILDSSWQDELSVGKWFVCVDKKRGDQ